MVTFEPDEVQRALSEMERESIYYLAAAQSLALGRIDKAEYLTRRWAFRRARATYARTHGISAPPHPDGGVVIPFTRRGQSPAGDGR
jgi:hypothetical protein